MISCIWCQVPDIVSQNSVLYSLQKGAQWQTALTTLDTCHCSSLQTSSVTYGTVLKLCKESLHSMVQQCLVFGCWIPVRSFGCMTQVCIGSQFRVCQDLWLLALHSLRRMGWVNLESNVVISGSMIASCETVSLWLRAMELLQYPSIIGCLEVNVATPCAKTCENNRKQKQIVLSLSLFYTIQIHTICWSVFDGVTRMRKVNILSSRSFEQKEVYPASLSLGDISQLTCRITYDTYVSIKSHQFVS